MANTNYIADVPETLKKQVEKISGLIESFAKTCNPLEQSSLFILADSCTDALYCECHVRADTLVKRGTIDVPLDPDEQPEYRANRELVEDHTAYERMRDDADNGRCFSNLVVEFQEAVDDEPSLMIVGGQHRFEAIRLALEKGVNQYHGVKVYFALDTEQRLDVQLISNTNIAVSTDLLDRMYETVSGPELRNWCQQVGLLDEGQDFADKRQRGQPITVRAARTFITNYLAGKEVDPFKFDNTGTTPSVAKTGTDDPDWKNLKQKTVGIWKDAELKEAGHQFATLAQAQRDYFFDKKTGKRSNVDFAEKALNYAALSAWAFTAGILHKNKVRLKRHFSLKDTDGKDPLNCAALARGRHKTDSENYRGLGYRTDAKERGRFVELFYLQADKREGISKSLVDLAIKKYHAKQAMREVREAEENV